MHSISSVCVRELFNPCSSVVIVFLYIALIFHIFRTTQDKISMPQPPHTHRNHTPITPHPKTVVLPIASLSYLPSQKSLRFLTQHYHHPQAPPHHTHHHTHPGVHTHIPMSQIHVRLLPSSFTGTYHNHSIFSRSPIPFTTSST